MRRALQHSFTWLGVALILSACGNPSLPSVFSNSPAAETVNPRATVVEEQRTAPASTAESIISVPNETTVLATSTAAPSQATAEPAAVPTATPVATTERAAGAVPEPQSVAFEDAYPQELVWSPDGHVLALVDPEALYLLDAASKSIERCWTPEGNDAFVEQWLNGVAFSPDGAWLAAATSTGVWVWPWSSGANLGEPLAKLVGHDNEVTQAVFSPNSKLLASSSLDGTIRLWDMESCKKGPAAGCGTPVRVIDAHQTTVNDVRFSTDGSLLVSEGGDGTVRIWRTADGSLVRVFQSYLPFQSDHTLALSPDGALVAVRSRNDFIWLCSVSEGKLVKAIPAVEPQNLAFSPDGTLLTWTSGDEVLFDSVTGKGTPPSIKIDDDVASTAFSVDGSSLAVGKYNQLSLLPLAAPLKSEIQRTPQPQPGTCLAPHDNDIQVIHNPDWAETYMANIGRRLKTYEYANFGSTSYESTPVSLPDGETGLLAVVGWSHKYPGTLFLFRQKADQIELIDWISGPNGLSEVFLSTSAAAFVPVDLFSDGSGHGPVLRVRSRNGAGSGLGSEGFGLVELRDDGLRLLYEGESRSWVLKLEDGELVKHEHDFTDLNGDGIKEIVDRSETCQVVPRDDDWVELGCNPEPAKVYTYNGTAFVESQDLQP